MQQALYQDLGIDLLLKLKIRFVCLVIQLCLTLQKLGLVSPKYLY